MKKNKKINLSFLIIALFVFLIPYISCAQDLGVIVDDGTKCCILRNKNGLPMKCEEPWVENNLKFCSAFREDLGQYLEQYDRGCENFPEECEWAASGASETGEEAADISGWTKTECEAAGHDWDSARNICYLKEAGAELEVPIPVPGEGILENAKDISSYISAIYRFGVAAAVIIAAVMIMFGGFLWLAAAGSPERVSRAKSYIFGSTIGMIIALSSYVVLQTINPALVTLEGIKITPVKRAIKFEGEACKSRAPIRLPCGDEFACDKKIKGTDGEEYYPCSEENIAFEGTCIGMDCTEEETKCLEIKYKIEPEEKSEYRCGLIDNRLFEYCNSKSSCGDISGWEEVSLYCERCPKINTGETCQITTERENLVCVSAKEEEEHCERDEDCQSRICNTAWNNTCCPEGGCEAGTSCDEDDDCASGICNEGTIPDECCPEGGCLGGTSCDGDPVCASNACNKAFLRDQCCGPGGTNPCGPGKPCDRKKECPDGYYCDEEEEKCLETEIIP